MSYESRQFYNLMEAAEPDQELYEISRENGIWNGNWCSMVCVHSVHDPTVIGKSYRCRLLAPIFTDTRKFIQFRLHGRYKAPITMLSTERYEVMTSDEYHAFLTHFLASPYKCEYVRYDRDGHMATMSRIYHGGEESDWLLEFEHKDTRYRISRYWGWRMLKVWSAKPPS